MATNALSQTNNPLLARSATTDSEPHPINPGELPTRRRHHEGDDDNARALAPVPVRFYFLFVVPLLLLMLWALFLKR